MQINDSKEANDKIIDIRKDRDIKIILNKNKLGNLDE